MDQAEWAATRDVAAMLEAVRATASERKLRLFACACAWRVLPLMARCYVHEAPAPYRTNPDFPQTTVYPSGRMRECEEKEGPRAERQKWYRMALEVSEEYAEGRELAGKTPWDLATDFPSEAWESHARKSWTADEAIRPYFRTCCDAVDRATVAAARDAVIAPFEGDDDGFPALVAPAAADAFGAMAVWAGASELIWSLWQYEPDAIGEYDQRYAEEERRCTAAWHEARDREANVQADLCRDLFGNTFHPVLIDPGWINEKVKELSAGAYNEGRLSEGGVNAGRLLVLADALEEAGCTDPLILTHFRGKAHHVRGSWALDLLLGKK
jgi:hypothetical protein